MDRSEKIYVLVGADVFERLQRLKESAEDLSVEIVAELVDRALREDDAVDPTLAFYQQKYGK